MFYFEHSSAADWGSGFIADATYDASVAWHSCVRFWGSWGEGSNEWAVISWARYCRVQIASFFLFLGYLANLYACLQPCHICTDLGSGSEKNHPAREAFMGQVLLKINCFIYFSKVCGDWSFLPVCSCGSSKVNVWLQPKWCGQSEFFAEAYVRAINYCIVWVMMLSSSTWS